MRVPKENFIELPNGLRIPILYEDRGVLAIDKPRGWMLAPVSWQNTGRNLQAALMSSLAARNFPVVGDELYGKPAGIGEKPLGLRAIELKYVDPFTRRRVEIRAPVEDFIREHGFEI